MRLMLSIVAAGLLLLSVVSHAAQQPTAMPVTERAIDGIRSGDGAVIREVGKSGNVQFVPYLKVALQNIVGSGDRPVAHWEVPLFLREALVTLDDTATQQEFWCWLIRDNDDSPIEAVADIGGWFSIQALEAVLNGAGHDGALRAFEHRSPDQHSPHLTPAQHALNALPKVLPNGPFGGLEQLPPDWSAAERGWRDWIVAHRSELASMRPAGEGVVFTEAACEKVTLDRTWF